MKKRLTQLQAHKYNQQYIDNSLLSSFFVSKIVIGPY